MHLDAIINSDEEFHFEEKIPGFWRTISVFVFFSLICQLGLSVPLTLKHTESWVRVTTLFINNKTSPREPAMAHIHTKKKIACIVFVKRWRLATVAWHSVWKQWKGGDSSQVVLTLQLVNHSRDGNLIISRGQVNTYLYTHRHAHAHTHIYIVGRTNILNHTYYVCT